MNTRPASQQRQARILIVDDDEGIRDSLEEILEDDYEVECAENGVQALERIRDKMFDVVLLDLVMPEIGGLETLKNIKEREAGMDVVMISATDRAKEAIEAINAGAYDYITKPFEPDEILTIVQRLIEKRSLEHEVSYFRAQAAQQKEKYRIITQSQPMKDVLRIVNKVAPATSNVLIQGESGTGKELIARAIHAKSTRADKHFVAINCASIPSELIESELFGYEKGAFTGAFRQTIGKFEFAHTGTIFLDEIATLRKELQAKLLRFLQEREFTRVGSTRSIEVDVRVIAATNTRLEELVKNGHFREDLYFRLNVIPVTLPPLRDRKGDVPLLSNYFLNMFNKHLNKKVSGISKDAMALLERYPWPGNIRELENFIERMVVLGTDEEPVDEQDLPLDLFFQDSLLVPEGVGNHEVQSLTEARQAFEREYILRVLNNCRWNQTKAAQKLKVHRNTLLNKMKALDLTEKNKRD